LIYKSPLFQSESRSLQPNIGISTKFVRSPYNVPVYFTLLHEKNALFSILLISLNSCIIQFANTTEKKNLHIDTLNTYIKNYLPNEVGKEQVVLTLEPITTDNILEICLKNKYTLVLFSYPCPTTIDYVRETILLAKKIEESKAYEFKFIIASATYDIDFYKQVHNFYKKTIFFRRIPIW